jgi:lipoprotein-anchoring transpeptidase ErfK/SrfK
MLLCASAFWCPAPGYLVGGGYALGRGAATGIRSSLVKRYADLARRRGSAVVAVATVALTVAAAGCSAGATGHSATEAKAAGSARLTIAPTNGMHSVRPGAWVTVRASNGHLRGVVVTAAGVAVAGGLSGGGTIWRSRSHLLPSTSYTVRATAVSASGHKIRASSSFRTLTPRKTVQVTLLEANNQAYGIGMPIVLTFSRSVTNRKAVERSLSVTTSRPVIGAWYWDGSKTVEFRPRRYWSPGTHVSFTGRLAGIEVAKGVYATHNVHVDFRIGPSLIVKASTVTHYMNVYYKGKLLGHWAISTGRPGDDTPNGTYLTIEKANPTFMTGPGYALWVPWAVRITWTGVYIHDAYWSVWAQGSINVSHGCVNTSPAHAETYYKLELPGDPVTITGSPRPGTWDNGWTEWFLPFRKYLRGSALHDAVVAGPQGSTFVSASTVVPPAVVGPRGHGIV